MVARIIKGKNIAGLVKYNEKEKSSVLYSQYINDAKDAGELTLQDKIEVLQAYIRLNPGVAKPTFHVSLNPDPEDKLDDDQLRAIGQEYMTAMNYGHQPYLIYKHEDLARVHLHIVSVNIGLDGRVINSSHERYRSETIRKQLELKYHLVKAGDKARAERPVLAPIDVAAIVYGQTDTKSALARVVRQAAREFTFTSLPAFRALLNYYQVTVDEVRDSQDPDKTMGLFYAVINARGEKVSARLKASSLGPGLGYEALVSKFEQGSRALADQNLIPLISGRIAAALDASAGLSLQDFQAHLSQQGLQVVYRLKKEQKLPDLTFIDIHTKTVLPHQALEPALPADVLQTLFP
jgi:Relaxase/Mobilisation nuclease domain